MNSISPVSYTHLDCHMDGIILKPDLYLDDQQIIKNGEFLLQY